MRSLIGLPSPKGRTPPLFPGADKYRHPPIFPELHEHDIPSVGPAFLSSTKVQDNKKDKKPKKAAMRAAKKKPRTSR